MTANKPQYYGYWITPERINSIFFMNIDWISVNLPTHKFGGTIEDKLGTAKFTGEKSPREIIFTKKYTHMHSAYASKFPLEYKGSKIKNLKDFYEGVYTGKDEDGNYLSGAFILQPFPQHSKTMNSLLKDFLEKRGR